MRRRACRKSDPTLAPVPALDHDRRAFLSAAGLAAFAGMPAPAFAGAPARADAQGTLGIPGPFRGRVVEVRDPKAVPDGVPDPDAVRALVRRGITALTGIDDPVAAWRSMFEPGDVVGIKVNPVGQPLAISNYATVHALVEGLASAGVRPRDVIVFDRYRDQFLSAGYEKNLPDGCRWDAAVDTYDEAQLDIADYDPDAFVTLDIVHAKPGVHDPKDERTRRSHLAKIVTRKVNKVIAIPVLKDHGSGGVTLALKNLSHGLVNNVCRSHGTAETNTCNLFIPAVVAHPVIRRKVVLQVLDGLNAVFERGPGSRQEFVWQYGALFFATDPVALDRVGWGIVDRKREAMGLPPVAQTGRAGKDPFKKEAFDFRQPQHIAGAGALGLGEYDPSKIDHKVIKVG